MKILIELPSWLGDAAMATPAIEHILEHFNNAEISLVGSFSSTELLKNHPKVTEVKVLDKKYLSLYRIAKNLGNFDNYFSFRGSIRSKFFHPKNGNIVKYQANQPEDFKNLIDILKKLSKT